MNKFRPLRADEIEARTQHITKDGNGAILILYKDARVDMDLLDETVGAMNWKKEYTRDNKNCIVSIYDEDKKEWISKEDVGTESNTEKEKGLASDSFKRACVNWGIGRELYTTPLVYIRADQVNDLKKAKYKVKEIDYTEDRVINKLVITREDGVEVYKYENGKTVYIKSNNINATNTKSNTSNYNNANSNNSNNSSSNSNINNVAKERAVELLRIFMQNYNLEQSKANERLKELLNLKKLNLKDLATITVDEFNKIKNEILA